MDRRVREPIIDEKLLHDNFDGYEIPNNSKRTVCALLETPVHSISMDSDVSILRNLLIGEQTETSESVYLVDRTKNVQKVTLVENKTELEICKVWKFPKNNEMLPSDIVQMYNPCVKFISKTLAIASDGISTFYLLNTRNRSSRISLNRWEILHSEELLQGRGFYIQDAVIKNRELHVLLCCLEKNSIMPPYLAVHWITLINENNIWNQNSLRELSVPSNTTYVYLERSCAAIYVASTNTSRVIFDSENVLIETNDAHRGVVSEYLVWSQDAHFVTIHFILPENIVKEKLKIFYDAVFIEVDYSNLRLLEGALYSTIFHTLTTMLIYNNMVIITLAKCAEKVWCGLLRDCDTSNQYIGETESILDQPIIDEFGNTVENLTVYRDSYRNTNHMILERLCGHTHRITHRCSFGVSPIVVTSEPTNSHIPKIGVYYQKDVVIWEPCVGEREMEHSTTLIHLGEPSIKNEYKRFMYCPPNFEYTVITDMHGHFYLYQQHMKIESGKLMKIRTNSGPKPAEKNIFFTPNGKILGIYCAKLGFYVLSDTYVMYVEL